MNYATEVIVFWIPGCTNIPTSHLLSQSSPQKLLPPLQNDPEIHARRSRDFDGAPVWAFWAPISHTTSCYKFFRLSIIKKTSSNIGKLFVKVIKRHTAVISYLFFNFLHKLVEKSRMVSHILPGRISTTFSEQPNPLRDILLTHHITTTDFHELPTEIRGGIVLQSQKTNGRADLAGW